MDDLEAQLPNVRRVNELVRLLNKKWPYGEFICLPAFDSDLKHITCAAMFDWKCEILDFYHEPIEKFIELLEKKLGEWIE